MGTVRLEVHSNESVIHKNYKNVLTPVSSLGFRLNPAKPQDLGPKAYGFGSEVSTVSLA